MLSDINYSVPITLVVVNNYERFEKSNNRFESYFKKVFWCKDLYMYTIETVK